MLKTSKLKNIKNNLLTKETVNVLLLLIVAIIWGAGFTFNKLALNSGASPSFIGVLRFGGASVIFPIIMHKRILWSDLKQWKYGVLCGIPMFAGFLLQNIGQKYTTPSNSALFTATCVVIVPFLSWIFLKSRPTKKIILCALLCIIGVVIISGSGNTFSLNFGDIITLAGAVAFAFHFITITYSLKKVNNFTLTWMEFVACAILFTIYFLLFEFDANTVIDVSMLWVPILCLTLFSSVCGYTIQLYSQQFVSASKTSIILCTESAFGPVISIIFGLELFSLNTLIGGFFVLLSAILLEVKIKKQATITDKSDISSN